ncbi:MAG: class I SAM-dependent methyltransferase [Gemmataceae bacterium]|nr:class I SAM-dependent methyltransferase [Gemmataceae bacterium]
MAAGAAHLRLFDAGEEGGDGLADRLFAAEILRPLPRRLDPMPPGSLPWYLAAERLRYERQGAWLPALLEFDRHGGDRVLGIGGGLGTDWVRYAGHGAEVSVACPVAAELDLVRGNFALRRLQARCEQSPPTALPFGTGSMDVAVIAAPLSSAVVEEAWRVLKPGGKVLALAPATGTVDGWMRWLPGSRSIVHLPEGLLAREARRWRARELRELFGRFAEPTVSQRHLRRAELPAMLRLAPLFLMERVAGRLLAFKGFKPLSAAHAEQAAA